MKNDARPFGSDHSDVIAIRRSFYRGLSRCCLISAWSALNQKRESLEKFLGTTLAKPGVSQLKVATAIDRNPGEICRWLQGKSPEWSNLMVVLLVLDAEWSDLRRLPLKKDRRNAGYSAALAFIQRKLLGDEQRQVQPPTSGELDRIEALFGQEQWEVVRRLARRRSKLLREVAESRREKVQPLDTADKTWGDAFSILRRAYAESIDVAIWR